MSQDKPTKYSLEVFPPGDNDRAAVTFTSATPFGAIGKGDLLNPGGFGLERERDQFWRVIAVVHLLWEVDGPAHRVQVYTRAEPLHESAITG